MNRGGMVHYDFPARFRAIYDHAVAMYAQGQRKPEDFFNAEQRQFLASNGLAAQHLYDYAEDHNSAGEPGYDHALGIELVRRDYFLNAQRGVASATILDDSTLPPKTDSVKGIEWLPRIIPKAKAKLRGELPPSLMYCCGGDRRFFKANNILPAEFLSIVWRNEFNDTATVDWVARRHG